VGVTTTAPLRSLPTAARTRWRVQGALVGALLAVVVAIGPTILLAVWLESQGALFLPVLFLVVGAGLGVVWANRRYARFGYALDEESVRVRDGVVFHSDAIAPLYRVQHVDIGRGPLQLTFGLATLTIHTAAPAADIRLPDLHADDASQVRDDILAASRRAAEQLGVADVDAV
jgi:membrane protein YdbS with pleckstrin-like domain